MRCLRRSCVWLAMFPWVSRLTKSKKSMPELRRSSLSFQRSAKSPGRVMLLSPSLVWKWNGSSKWMTMVRRSSVLRDSAARAASFRGVSNMCAAVIGVGGRVLGELSESVEGVDAVEDEDEPDGFAERGVASGCRTREVASRLAPSTKLPLNLEPKMSLCVKFPFSHRTDPGSAHVLSVFSPFTDRTATAAVARLKLCEFDIRGMLERSDVPISLCRQMTLVSCQISWMCETSQRGTWWEPVVIVVLILIFILICSFHLHPHLLLTLRQQGSMCAAHDSLPRCGHTHGTPCNAPPATLHRTTTPGTVPTLSTNQLNPLQKNTTWKTTAQNGVISALSSWTVTNLKTAGASDLQVNQSTRRRGQGGAKVNKSIGKTTDNSVISAPSSWTAVSIGMADASSQARQSTG